MALLLASCKSSMEYNEFPYGRPGQGDMKTKRQCLLHEVVGEYKCKKCDPKTFRIVSTGDPNIVSFTLAFSRYNKNESDFTGYLYNNSITYSQSSGKIRYPNRRYLYMEQRHILDLPCGSVELLPVARISGDKIYAYPENIDKNIYKQAETQTYNNR